MTRKPKGLLDTSVFIAVESGRGIDDSALPVESAVSVVTLAELTAGVLAATDLSVRAVRLGTLGQLTDIELLVLDEDVATQWATLRVLLADRGRRANINDTWIAATALAHGLPVVTQDGDFSVLAEVGGVQLIRV